MTWQKRIFLLALLLPLMSHGQGKLMLCGGGGEVEGGWSDAPYRWAVEQSANKKVAVISYSDEDNFIPDYFMSLGAADAVNIKIDTRAVADAQATYDMLMQYDVFFFKGGDQSRYYQYYKDTRTAQAIAEKFNAGGVMAGTSAGMAILSGVLFTAENGSVYPDEALADFMQNKIALADDFLQLYPGYIFDSHFTERGRVARLLAFMAKWYFDRNVSLTGIGVDDRTALCIGSNHLATVYGTGSVSFYIGNSFDFSQGEKLAADSIHAIQLLHGHTIDLDAGFTIINGPDETLEPTPAEETGNYHVVLSGAEGVGTNSAFLQYLVTTAGTATDTVMIVTAPGKGVAYRDRLSALGAKSVIIETSAAFNDASQIDLRNAIRRARKILFAENDDDRLFSFLQAGPTGILLDGHIRRNNIVTAFAGDDSRYAGKVFVTNHTSDMYAAYYGRLAYRRGLGLLQTSVVMPNAYDASTTDFYENTTASVSYALMKDSLRFGVYLNRGSYIACVPASGVNQWRAGGTHPAVIISNVGTERALASQPVNAGGAARQYVGFSGARYTVLTGSATLFAGLAQPSNDLPYEFESAIVGLEQDFDRSSFIMFPNPSASGIFYVEGEHAATATLAVTDALGRNLWQSKRTDGPQQVNLSGYPDGVYFLSMRRGAQTIVKKLMKSSGNHP